MDLEEDIVRRYSAMVWATVYRLLNHEAETADCFQDTFAAALEMGRREKIRTWEGMLKRIATTKALDSLRRRIRERKRNVVGIIWEEVPGQNGGAGEDAEWRELGEHMRRALTSLPVPQGEVFCMRHLSDMSYEEIGAEVGMKTIAVGVMLTRTKAKLAGLLGETSTMRGEVNYGK